MHSIMIAAICCGWLAFVWTVLLAAGKGKAAKTREGYWEKEAGRIRRQAEQAGVSWGSRETIAIWVVSLAIAGLLLRGVIVAAAIAGVALLVYYGNSGMFFPDGWDWEEEFAFTLIGLR